MIDVGRVVVTSDGRQVRVRESMYLALRHAGVIVETSEGAVTAEDGRGLDREIERRPSLMVCDFCSSTPVAVSYPTRDYEFELVKGLGARRGSLGAWAACARCAELVDAGKRDALTQRSLDLLPIRVPKTVRRTLGRELRRHHDDFWRNREGPGVPTEEPS